MAYSIEFTAAAKRQFDKLPQAVKRRLADTVERLSQNPRPPSVKKLSDGEGLFRVRSGDCRIVYRIEDNRLLVLVVKIGHRREIYR